MRLQATAKMQVFELAMVPAIEHAYVANQYPYSPFPY